MQVFRRAIAFRANEIPALRFAPAGMTGSYGSKPPVANQAAFLQINRRGN
jgi:hypothetical protein